MANQTPEQATTERQIADAKAKLAAAERAGATNTAAAMSRIIARLGGR